MLSDTEIVQGLGDFEKNNALEGNDLSQKIHKLHPIALEQFLRTSAGLFHKALREEKSETCLVLLKKVSREFLEEALQENDAKGKNALQVAIIERGKLKPEVVAYFVRKLSFISMSNALSSNLEPKDEANYLPIKANRVILKAIIDRCLSGASEEDPFRASLFRGVDDYFGLTEMPLTPERIKVRKSILSLDPNSDAVNHETEAFLAFFQEEAIPDHPKDITAEHLKWLPHIDLALSKAHNKEVRAVLCALKVRLFYYLWHKKIPADGANVESLQALALGIYIEHVDRIDSSDCVALFEILSTPFLRAADEQKFDDPHGDFLTQRLQWVHAAVIKGRLDYAPYLHGLMAKYVALNEAENRDPEQWEEADEARYARVRPDDHSGMDMMKTRLNLKIDANLANGILQERFELLARMKFKAIKQEKSGFQHNQCNFPDYPFTAFPSDFEEFRNKNIALAENTKQALSTAQSKLEIEERFNAYENQLKKLNDDFIVKINDVRCLRKVAFFENNYMKAKVDGDEEKDAIQNHFPTAADFHTYLKHKEASLPLFLLKRGIKETLNAEKKRLDDRIKTTASDIQKTILLRRKTTIEAFLIQLPNKETTEATLKAELLLLSKQMTATTKAHQWLNACCPRFFKSTGESTIDNLANQLQGEVSDERAPLLSTALR